MDGTYSCIGSWSIEGVYAPAREPGREGAREVLPSRKLDGGSLFVDTLSGRADTEPWNTGTCCALALSACSGVCARIADALNERIVGLSERLKLDIEEPGREGVRTCTAGTGIIDLLGGRGGWEPGDAVLNAEVENAGEWERVKSASSSSHPPTDLGPAGPEMDLNVRDGAGM